MLRIIQLFDDASVKGKLAHPKITVYLDNGTKLRLTRAGSMSKYPGSVTVTDGRPYGENTYYGRISRDGVWQPTVSLQLPAYKDQYDLILRTMQDLAKDPAAFGKIHGQRTNHCCFCGRELTQRDSVAVGYGPICADKWNLPHAGMADEIIEDEQKHVTLVNPLEF